LLALSASGNFDGVGVDHPNTLEELVKAQFKAIIEAPENGSITEIPFPGSVEVENFFHAAPNSSHYYRT
jgi:hypothetical protein